MAIVRSGPNWIGSEAADLEEYLRELTGDGYPTSRFVHARCACSNDRFTLDVDADEGCGQRTCTACHEAHLICDSDEMWSDAEPEAVTCSCGASSYQIVVGFSLRERAEVRWITVGVRCATCGTLGSPVDWKIDYEPTDHLFEQV